MRHAGLSLYLQVIVIRLSQQVPSCYPSVLKSLILYFFRQNKLSPDIKKSDSVPVTFFDAGNFYVIFIPGSIKIGQDPYFGEHRSCPFPCWQAYAHRKRQGL